MSQALLVIKRTIPLLRSNSVTPTSQGDHADSAFFGWAVNLNIHLHCLVLDGVNSLGIWIGPGLGPRVIANKMALQYALYQQGKPLYVRVGDRSGFYIIYIKSRPAPINADQLIGVLQAQTLISRGLKIVQ